MAKLTKLPSPGPDDPIFSQKPIVSSPVGRPSPGINLDELRKVPDIKRGTLEESMLQQIADRETNR